MSETEPSNSSDVPRTRITGGIFWTFFLRWGLRALGFVNVLVLARLLSPSDFGLVGQASLIIGLIAIFTDFGLQAFLIRNQEVTREHYDTVWTLSILVGIAKCLALILISPLVAGYFEEPRVVLVVQVLAVSVLIDGFGNVGTVDFRKKLIFERDFVFEISVKVTSVAVGIILAILIKNYWAIVIAGVAAVCVRVGLSYIMSSYRPRLTLVKVRSMFGFSMAVTAQGAGRYFNRSFGNIVAGRQASTQEFGAFHIAYELSALVTRELVSPLTRALFPNIAIQKQNQTLFKQGTRLTLGAAFLLGLPAGFGLSSVAPEFVDVVLGWQWGAATPLLQWLAIALAFGVLNEHINVTMMVVGGGERHAVALSWMRVALMCPAVLIAAVYYGYTSIPVAMALVNGAFIFVSFYGASLVLPLRFREILGDFWRPALASVLMWQIVRSQWISIEDFGMIVLFLKIAIGALSYGVILLALWAVCGRPKGIESGVIAKLEAVRDSRKLSRAVKLNRTP